METSSIKGIWKYVHFVIANKVKESHPSHPVLWEQIEDEVTNSTKIPKNPPSTLSADKYPEQK